MSDQKAEIVLKARDLKRSYEVRRGLFAGSATVQALGGVSFEVARGQTLAVVGESGCGKSTLARLLTMIEAPSAGSLQLKGVEVAAASEEQKRLLRRQVQIVFQNPYGSLNPRQTVIDALMEPLLVNGIGDAASRRAEAESMMARVGLRPEQAARYPHMFSGGQRQRIAIARAMMLNPRVVVADEPVSALDVSIQAQILNLFMDLQDEFGTGYVFISHNLSVVEHVAKDLLVMYLGRAVEYGDKARIFARPLHPYTQALMSATPALRAQDRRLRIKIQGELPSPLNPPSGCAFHKRCPLAQARCAVEEPELREVDGRQVACHLV